MHLTGIMLTTDTEHTGYYITDYSNHPTHVNPLDEQQQICIYTAYNKPPIHSNYEHSLLHHTHQQPQHRQHQL
jgi:hypothetical protein